jgi:hypothetical protein
MSFITQKNSISQILEKADRKRSLSQILEKAGRKMKIVLPEAEPRVSPILPEIAVHRVELAHKIK